MVITRSAHPALLWPGVLDFVTDRYRKWPAIYSQIFETRKTNRAFEEIVALGSLPLARVKAEGQSTEYVDISQGPTTRFTPVAYSLGTIVTREAIDDNLYKDKAFQLGALLTDSFMTTKEIVHANVLNRAFSSSYPGSDGVSLINASHPVEGGTQSNVLSVAADLSEASLEDALTQIRNMKNSQGHPIRVRGMKLVVSPSWEFEAYRILNSTLQSGSQNNDVNALRAMGMLPGGVIVNPYLTDDDAWFIITDAPLGLLSFQRTPFEYKKENDFDTDNAKAKGYERYTPGWADFRAIVGTPGA